MMAELSNNTKAKQDAATLQNIRETSRQGLRPIIKRRGLAPDFVNPDDVSMEDSVEPRRPKKKQTRGGKRGLGRVRDPGCGEKRNCGVENGETSANAEPRIEVEAESGKEIPRRMEKKSDTKEQSEMERKAEAMINVVDEASGAVARMQGIEKRKRKEKKKAHRIEKEEKKIEKASGEKDKSRERKKSKIDSGDARVTLANADPESEKTYHEEPKKEMRRYPETKEKVLETVKKGKENETEEASGRKAKRRAMKKMKRKEKREKIKLDREKTVMKKLDEVSGTQDEKSNETSRKNVTAKNKHELHESCPEFQEGLPLQKRKTKRQLNMTGLQNEIEECVPEKSSDLKYREDDTRKTERTENEFATTSTLNVAEIEEDEHMAGAEEMDISSIHHYREEVESGGLSDSWKTGTSGSEGDEYGSHGSCTDHQMNADTYPREEDEQVLESCEDGFFVKDNMSNKDVANDQHTGMDEQREECNPHYVGSTESNAFFEDASSNEIPTLETLFREPERFFHNESGYVIARTPAAGRDKISPGEWNEMSKSQMGRYLERGTWEEPVLDRWRKMNPVCVPIIREHHVLELQARLKATIICRFADCQMVSKVTIHNDLTFTATFQSDCEILSHGHQVQVIKHSTKEWRARNFSGKRRQDFQKNIMSGLSTTQKTYHETMINADNNKLAVNNFDGVPKRAVYRTAANEARREKIPGGEISVPISQMMEEMNSRYGNKVPGFIQTFSRNPLVIVVATEESIRLYHDICREDVLLVDSTGQLAKAVNGKEIYYYEAVIRGSSVGESVTPVFGMFSDCQDEATVNAWLRRVRHLEGEIYGPLHLVQPPLIMIDESATLLKAMCDEYNRETPFDYYNRAFRIVNGQATAADLKKSVIKACDSHWNHKLPPKINSYYSDKSKGMYLLNLLANATMLSTLKRILFDLCVLLWSNEVRDITLEAQQRLEKDIKCLNKHCSADGPAMSTPETVKDPGPKQDPKQAHPYQEKIAIVRGRGTAFQLWSQQILDEAKRAVSASTIVRQENPACGRRFLQYIIEELMPQIPFWGRLLLGDLSRHHITGALADKPFHFVSQPPNTNGHVEQRFGNIKSKLLRKNLKPSVEVTLEALADNYHALCISYSVEKRRASCEKKTVAKNIRSPHVHEKWAKKNKHPRRKFTYSSGTTIDLLKPRPTDKAPRTNSPTKSGQTRKTPTISRSSTPKKTHDSRKTPHIPESPEVPVADKNGAISAVFHCLSSLTPVRNWVTSVKTEMLNYIETNVVNVLKSLMAGDKVSDLAFERVIYRTHQLLSASPGSEQDPHEFYLQLLAPILAKYLLPEITVETTISCEDSTCQDIIESVETAVSIPVYISSTDSGVQERLESLVKSGIVEEPIMGATCEKGHDRYTSERIVNPGSLPSVLVFNLLRNEAEGNVTVHGRLFVRKEEFKLAGCVVIDQKKEGREYYAMLYADAITRIQGTTKRQATSEDFAAVVQHAYLVFYERVDKPLHERPDTATTTDAGPSTRAPTRVPGTETSRRATIQGDSQTSGRLQELIRQDSTKTYVEGWVGKYKLLTDDFRSLTRELNDQVINAYCQGLAEASLDSSVYAMDVNLVTQMMTTRHLPTVNKSTKLLEKRVLLLPFNRGRHWVLMVYWPRNNAAVYLDSLGAQSERRNLAEYGTHLRRFLCTRQKQEGVARGKVDVSTVAHSEQSDSTSCGLFVCKFAKQLASQDDADLTGKLPVKALVEEIGQDLIRFMGSMDKNCSVCGIYGYEDHGEVMTKCSSCELKFHAHCISDDLLGFVGTDYLCVGCR